MRAAALSLLALVTVSLASPVAAAEGLDCVYDGADDVLRATVLQAFGGDRSGTPLMQQKLAEIAAACVQQHHWPAGAAPVAVQYGMARIIRDDLVRNSPFDTEQMQRVDALLDGIAPETAQRWWTNGMAPEDGGEFARLIVQAGLPLDPVKGRFIGQYGAIRYHLNRLRAQFVAL